MVDVLPFLVSRGCPFDEKNPRTGWPLHICFVVDGSPYYAGVGALEEQVAVRLLMQTT